MGRSATQTVYDRLRALLVRGQISPGTRLVESRWASHLEANHAALREASMVLAHESLLDRGPNGGYFVPRNDAERIAQILAVRRILELGALRELESLPPDQDGLDRLDAVCDQMARMVEEDYIMGFAEADRRFHVCLIELAQNPHLAHIYRSTPLPLIPPALVAPDLLREQHQATLTEHQTIVDLLCEGDFSSARAVLSDHLSDHHQPAVYLSGRVFEMSSLVIAATIPSLGEGKTLCELGLAQQVECVRSVGPTATGTCSINVHDMPTQDRGVLVVDPVTEYTRRLSALFRIFQQTSAHPICINGHF